MTTISDLLKKELANRQKRNSQFSLRAFAKSLDMEPTSLSQILNQKRNLTAEKCKEIFDKLGYSQEKVNSILLAILNNEKIPLIEEEQFTYMDTIKEELEGSWLCYAILSLLETKDVQHNVTWIAERLGAKETEVGYICELLEEAGLISRDEDNWKFKNLSLSTKNGASRLSLVKVHEDYILKSIEALKFTSKDLRDISGMTFCCSKSKLSEAVRRIREFRRSLAAYLSDDELEEVYRLNIQLFPLSKNPNDEKQLT